MITIPTLIQIFEDIIADLESELNVDIPDSGKSFLRAQAAVDSAIIKLIYLTIGNLQKNIWPDTAEPEITGGTLERFGRVKLGRNPFPATAGQYDVIVTGSIGAVIPAQTTFKSDDSSLSPGFLFILDNEFTMDAVSETITLRALTAGVEAKLQIGNTLTATAPISLVDSAATVTDEVIEPRAAETIAAYRAAIVNAFQLEAQGGAGTDYRLWAADAQGVRFVYPYAKSGETSEVDLFVEATIDDSIDSKGTPSTALLSDVEDVVNFDPDNTRPLNERGRRPLTAIVNYLPITPLDVDIIINGYVGLDASIEAKILSTLTDAINQIRPFVASADILVNKNDILDVNKIISLILSAQPGSIFGSVTLEIDGTPLSTYTFAQGFIPYLNSVSYV
jgi:uncharacterized phage protein gp47/JayE